jgi:DNA invertase Pin-like site-specific DNA recombinase
VNVEVLIVAKGKPRPLRFAALIRVSTEKQEKQGESLRIQRSQIEVAVAQLGGKIIEWYGGQEHATPGHEKSEVNRLIRDSASGKFDAVIVAHEDRWSRDNIASAQGLDTFQNYNVRFFVGSRECSLIDPTIRFMLAQHAVIGEYHAANQSKKSIESRIERAKRGIPTSGKMPFGRTFIKPDGSWKIVDEKLAMMKDVASRYLAGEKIPDLAKEYGVNPSNLHKNLMKRCGDKWTETFDFPKFGIHEIVTHTIPRLLPEKTIKAVQEKAKRNKTYSHSYRNLNRYLLSGYIYCVHCGYALGGQPNHGVLNYRHPHHSRVRACNVPKGYINAQQIETAVIYDLYDMFGNPKAVERAIKAAIPNQGEVAELRAKQAKIEKSLANIVASKERIAEAVAKGTLTDSEVQNQIGKLRQQEEKQQAALQTICDQLAHLPTERAIRTVSDEVVKELNQALFPTKRHERRIDGVEYKINGESRDCFRLGMQISYLDSYLDTADDIYEAVAAIPWDEKRALVESVFSGSASDGKPAGVYIHWPPSDITRRPPWQYAVHGLFERKLTRMPKPRRTVSASH